MCEPATIIAIAGGIGAAVSAAGAVTQGVASAKAGAAAEVASERNSLLAQKAASDATARGEQEAGAYRLRASKVLGQTRAKLGASGVDVEAGTAGRVADDTKAIAELDVATIRNNAAREAWGYKMQSRNILKGGQEAVAASQWQTGGSLLLGGSNLLSGAADTYSAWKRSR